VVRVGLKGEEYMLKKYVLPDRNVILFRAAHDGAAGGQGFANP
jgi:hypothetical protein